MTDEEKRRQQEWLLRQPPMPARILKIESPVIDRKGLAQCEVNREINVEKGVPPVVIDRTLKADPVAIVGYGPTLLKTWERIREFKHVWSVSKAHSFLLEREITPELHFDLDPREHKTEFMQNPQKNIKYVLSTHIHPSYIDKLQAAECDVSLYHVAIDPEKRLDPRYPSLKPRFDVGMEAAEYAFVNGYRTQHWFGVDYGVEEGRSHAGSHWGPGATAPRLRMEVNGKILWTNVMFFHGLMLAELFLCDRALLKPTIHGDGLLGQFLQCRGRVPRLKVLV